MPRPTRHFAFASLVANLLTGFFIGAALCLPGAAHAQSPAPVTPPAAPAAACPVCPEGEYFCEPMQMCMKRRASQSMPTAPSSASPPASPSTTAHGDPQGDDDLSNMMITDLMISPDGCASGDYFNFGMSMCLPRPKRAGAASLMAMENVFLSELATGGARGRTDLASTNWIMLDGGLDLSRWNRLELDVMLTLERWTVPERGYTELLQIGENDAAGHPYLDAQHPHSSPIMGLTLIDVISFSSTKTRLLRIWFAPRGETTDGPIAFMHRPTGAVGPEAPLGHHIGQDVGHVTSTVIGAGLVLGGTQLEFSVFRGQEPEPLAVDLPVRAPDSVAGRVVQQVGQHFMAAASLAWVNNPENDPTIPSELRISASVYTQHDLPRGYRIHSTLVWGGITKYDHAEMLNSFLLEGLANDDANSFWSRVEVLQRTPAELAIASATPNAAQWVGAATAGYTRKLFGLWAFDVSAGVAGTLTFLPPDYQGAYGGGTIGSVMAFLQIRGSRMWTFNNR